MNLDIFLFSQIHDLAGRWVCLDSTAIFFASYFQYFLCVALLIFLFWGKGEELKKNRLMTALAFLAAIVSRFFFTEIIRWFWVRPRPFAEFDFTPLVGHEANASFPSGHAAFFFALAMVVFLFNKKAGWWFLTGAFLISLARVFAGLHYPADILAGALVGIFNGWLTKKIWFWFQKNKLFFIKNKSPKRNEFRKGA